MGKVWTGNVDLKKNSFPMVTESTLSDMYNLYLSNTLYTHFSNAQISQKEVSEAKAKEPPLWFTYWMYY